MMMKLIEYFFSLGPLACEFQIFYILLSVGDPPNNLMRSCLNSGYRLLTTTNFIRLGGDLCSASLRAFRQKIGKSPSVSFEMASAQKEST